MIPYMVGKLAPNSSHLSRGLAKYVPGRSYFRAVPSQNGDKIVHPRPPPPQSLNGSEGGEADSKVLGAYRRDMLNENGKLLLGFAEYNKLALLKTLFCTPKSGVSFTLQSANRSKGQARLDYILTKRADRRLIRCVNVRRPP